MVIKRKFTAFERTTNRYVGTAMRITAEQAKIVQEYKATKRALARKSYSEDGMKYRGNK